MKHFYASQHMTNIDIVPAINTCMNNLKLLRANPSMVLTFKTDAFGTTSKEKHFLTRKLVGYRNWRQWWCKKEENKGLGKEK